ncbi:NAD(P)-dependent oxidoreductase [Microbacterium dauci]|uniref:NAD(P)-dependent oxidoreductase n=1 Tax=Microbacterium dauci TaxID=3048008 RepID=A0ABT6ZB22_9MICO|nr:NAD(P)-dependent oxidoreductase [Microbacterium sp. LX3-4]MDJ1113358.1 NAD(P)-dependent oxidoreductase [Microbacterium sp. LX3-4]
MSTSLDDETASFRLGVLGLGAMGDPMAQRLLAARGALTVHARSPRPDLVAAGATWADSPRELAAHSDAVLVMLPDLPQLESALAGGDGLLAGAGDLLLLIGSTSSPTGVRALAERLDAESGGRIRVVDCPVSGGVDGATAGTLSIMLGGEPDAAALAASLLSPCGTPVHLGPLGAGEVAKACNQLVVAATITALGEASELAARSGIDLETLWTLLGSGYAGSNLLTSRKEKLTTGDDSPSGIAEYMVKDLGFAADVASATGIRPALLPTLRAIFDEIVDAGLGDRDIAVTRRLTAARPPAKPSHDGAGTDSGTTL